MKVTFMRLSLILFFSLPSFLFSMQVVQLDRAAAMPQWEKDKLAALVQNYDRAPYDPSSANSRLGEQVRAFHRNHQLARDFIDTCCVTPYANLDNNITKDGGPLMEMVKNPIGRELVYRIMAKVIPRQECLVLLRAFCRLSLQVEMCETV